MIEISEKNYREALEAVDKATDDLSAAKVRRFEAENNEMAARTAWICAIEALAVARAGMIGRRKEGEIE